MKTQKTELQKRDLARLRQSVWEQLHVPAPRKRVQAGWDRILFGYMRKHPANRETKRIERLLALMVTIQGHLDEVHRLLFDCDETKDVAEFLKQFGKIQELVSTYYRSLEELNTALKQYHWHSSVTGGLDGFKQELEWDNEAKSPEANWEHAMVRILLDETNKRGALSRFRKCSECRQWFYAATSHQQFCNDACRRRHTSRNPEFREKRRVYMREIYRPREREEEDRSLRNARKMKPGR